MSKEVNPIDPATIPLLINTPNITLSTEEKTEPSHALDLIDDTLHKIVHEVTDIRNIPQSIFPSAEFQPRERKTNRRQRR